MRAFALIIPLLFLVASKTHAISIDWHEDSPERFNVTFVGTGLSWGDTIVSPSGLWQLQASFFGRYAPDHAPDHPINMSHAATVTFLPDQWWMRAAIYNHYLPISTPQRGSGWDIRTEQFLWDWTGSLPFSITSMPILEDSSTWTWMATITASGPVVPESGGIVCLGFAALLLFAIPYVISESISLTRSEH